MIFLLKDKDGNRRKIRQSEALDDYISRRQLEMIAETLRSQPDEKFVFADGAETLTVYAGFVPRHGQVSTQVQVGVKVMCAVNNWYNAGTVPMYEHLLHDLVSEGDPVEVARDIFANTRRECSIEEQRALLEDMIRQIQGLYKLYERGCQHE